METTLTITTREIARRELAEARYGLGAEPISDPTYGAGVGLVALVLGNPPFISRKWTDFIRSPGCWPTATP